MTVTYNNYICYIENKIKQMIVNLKTNIHFYIIIKYNIDTTVLDFIEGN